MLTNCNRLVVLVVGGSKVLLEIDVTSVRSKGGKKKKKTKNHTTVDLIQSHPSLQDWNLSCRLEKSS